MQEKFDLEMSIKEQQRKFTECAETIKAYQNTLEDKEAGKEITNFQIERLKNLKTLKQRQIDEYEEKIENHVMDIDTLNVDIETNVSDLEQLEIKIQIDTHEQNRHQNNV